MATLNEKGQEVLDPTPISLKVPFNRPEPLHQRIRRMILLAQQEAGPDFETEADANDFDVPDDPNPDPTSPWEEHFMPSEETVSEKTGVPSATEVSELTVEQAKELLRRAEAAAAQKAEADSAEATPEPSA